MTKPSQTIAAADNKEIKETKEETTSEDTKEVKIKLKAVLTAFNNFS